MPAGSDRGGETDGRDGAGAERGGVAIRGGGGGHVGLSGSTAAVRQIKARHAEVLLRLWIDK